MKKRLLAGLAAWSLMLVMVGLAEAALVDYGPDSLGNKLIYDTDLDITWYDYTKSNDTWDNQMAWAKNLSVTHNGNTYTDWRLPSTVDGPLVYGYEGDPDGDGNYNYNVGYNLANSEMGHLYYEELGNLGWMDTSGNDFQPGYGLVNTGPFQNLIGAIPSYYWFGTEYALQPEIAWGFRMDEGSQWSLYLYKNNSFYGLAVHPGRPVPVPGALWLFGTGLAGLAGLKLRKK